MNEDELKAIATKKGYELVEIKRFKHHDRITLRAKDFVLRINLRKHLEETSLEKFSLT